jgi:antitoxin (DNA-binding transcriptional repressor) of toxin-antitoxin stability system
VGDPAARIVPVRRTYEDLLLELAERAGDGLIVGGDSIQPRNRLNKLLASVEHGRRHPVLAANRLRSTWIVDHLTAGARLPELKAAAGTQRIETFDELLAYVEPIGPSETAEMLRGNM